MSELVVRQEHGACTDVHGSDWHPLLEGEMSRTSYGHTLENISLLIDSAETIGEWNDHLLRHCQILFEYCLKYGYDKVRGGFFDSGKLGRPADNLEKVCWVQAEALWSSLQMYRLTRDRAYFAVFESTWNFVIRYQIDWSRGEWHEKVSGRRAINGDKAHLWKAGYHHGRTLIECAKILRALAKS
jgi:mannobiose 2-epimerase